jgi:ADP-heptose:LPS heptosyltransferase
LVEAKQNRILNIPLMKYADEYIGRLLCFALNLWGKKNSNAADKEVKNVLAVKFWGMGSIILTSPAVKSIKQNYPNAKLWYLTLGSNKEICSMISEIDEIVTIRLNNPFSFTLQTLKAISRLRKEKFDIVFDFEFYTYYSALIVRLIKAKDSIGFNNLKNNRSKLFTETVLFEEHKHTRDNFLNLAAVNCTSVTLEFADLRSQSTSPVVGFMTNNIRINNDNNMPLIVVNPNASPLAYERRLPAKDFAVIIERLASSGKYDIALTGNDEETEYVGRLYEKLTTKKNVTNLCGKLNVKQLTELIASSQCLLTNDSGPLHIASALNIPVISFFGPESPEKYGPLSSKKLVFYRGLACSPCMSVSNSKTVNCIYSEPICMSKFDMEEVSSKIESFLKTI